MPRNPLFLPLKSKSLGRKVQAAVVMPDGTVSCRKGKISSVNSDKTVTLHNGLTAHFDDIIFLD